jgi:hypothetical protein
MDTTNIVLKTKLSEALETLNLIILLYTVFLVGLGIILCNTEVIVQTSIMFVVYVIFEYINYDSIEISSKGMKSERYGFIDWNDIYRISKNSNIVKIYTKKREKPYKFIISKKEDSGEISRAYKYMLSKVKSPKRVKSQKSSVDII